MLDFRILKENKPDGSVNYVRVLLNALILFMIYFCGGILIGYFNRG